MDDPRIREYQLFVSKLIEKAELGLVIIEEVNQTERLIAAETGNKRRVFEKLATRIDKLQKEVGSLSRFAQWGR